MKTTGYVTGLRRELIRLAHQERNHVFSPKRPYGLLTSDIKWQRVKDLEENG